MTWPGEGDSERSARRRDDLGSNQKHVSIQNTAMKNERMREEAKILQLTVDVAVKGHHACPFGAAEGGVMQLIGQG